MSKDDFNDLIKDIEHVMTNIKDLDARYCIQRLLLLVVVLKNERKGV